MLFASYADVNRAEMFSPNIAGLTAKVNVENVINDEGLYYKIRGGLLFLKETKSRFIGPKRNFFCMDFSSQVGFHSTDNLNLIAGVSGRLGLNENAKLDLEGDQSTLYFGFGTSYKSKSIESGISLGAPLDDPAKGIVNNSIALSLLFHLK